MGRGARTSFSRKQKINAKSLTEAGLIGLDDMLPQILWKRYFLECQGFKVEENIVFQDNKSPLVLEKNRRTSSSKRSKQIKKRYFFIKNKIAQKEVEVKYCPTEQMWSDIMTKSWQEKQFQYMRAMIMNCPILWGYRRIRYQP